MITSSGISRAAGHHLVNPLYPSCWLAVSSGAACATASAEPSHVLRAIGLSDDQARASIRFGLGRFNTEQEIDAAAAVVISAVRLLRRRAM